MATITSPTPAENHREHAHQLPLHELMTESSNEASAGLDTKSALEIARIINHEDAKVAAAVKKGFRKLRK